MLIEWSEKHKQLYLAIKEFAANQICDSANFEQLWKMCGDFGIFKFCLTEKKGGLAASYKEIYSALYALGYGAENAGFVFAICNSLIVSSCILPNYATDVQKETFLVPLLNGDSIGAYAITEPEHGSDVFSMETTIEVQQDRIILNGLKSYISNAPVADLFIVVGRNTDSVDKYTVVIVKRNDLGVTVKKEIHKMGLESCPMGEISFEKVSLPLSRIIGGAGNGFLISNAALEWERSCSFAAHLGTLAQVMDMCIKYSNLRKQFGHSIGGNQLIKEKIVNMKMSTELGKLLLSDLAKKKDAGKNIYLESSMLKYFVSEKYVQACLDALQIHGAFGYSQESKIEKMVRDSLASKIYSGTSEIQIEIIGKMIGLK